MIKKLIIVPVCCVFLFLCASAEKPSGGLLFTSSKKKVDERTSLVLFGDKLQKYESTFSVSFDLSIWDSSQFGHVFRAINGKKQEIEFVFVNFYGTDRMYLDFHSPITHRSVQIPITQEDIDKKEVLHFDLTFDLEKDRASIVLRDSMYVCEPVGLENPSDLQFAFGMYGLNLDVPQMLIKNFRIRPRKGKTLFFPLDEPEGGSACDTTGKIAAVVKNPHWMINEHFYWKEKATFLFDNKVRVNYIESENQLCMIDNDSVLYFDPRYDRVISQPGSDPNIPDNEGESHLLHHNNFFSSSGDLYQFGGYRDYSYSNRISIYRKETGRWEPLDFKGNEIMPRFYSAVGDGVNEDVILIFGGFGNETGRQEHGGHNLYDLHLLNLKEQTVKHLWTLKSSETEFIPGSNLILSGDKKAFYALCYPHHLPRTVGYLYRFNLQNGNYDIMSDSLCFTSEGMSTSVNLFYNNELCEFYAVIRDLTEKNEHRLRIYSLLSPPVTKAQLERPLHLQKPYIWLFVLVVIFVLLLGESFLWWFVYVKKKKTEGNNPSREISIRRNTYRRGVQKPSAVYLFGDFTVYDRKGVNINYRFSMKLMTLFSLVLLNTDRNKGISTQDLSLALWPDKDVDDAKSIRGVTISRLRCILDDIDGIHLVHQKHQWFFVFESTFYCDWLEYSSILQRLPAIKQQNVYDSCMIRLVALVNNGMFLENVQDSELDPYKSREKEVLKQLFTNFILRLYESKQYDKINLLAPTFLSFDSLNEKAYSICIQSYNKADKKEDLKTLFFKNYKRVYNMRKWKRGNTN